MVNVTNGGILDVEGVTTINALGSDITLNVSANDFASTVNLNTNNTTGDGGTVTITSSADMFGINTVNINTSASGTGGSVAIDTTSITLGTVDASGATGGDISVDLSGDGSSLSLSGALSGNTFTASGDNNSNTFTTNSGATWAGVGAFAIDGNGSTDTFNLAANIGGTYEGGAGVDTFNINAGDITLSVIGDGGDDSITGFSTDNTWATSANEAGTVTNTAGGIITFSDVEVLNGSDGVDTFNLSHNFNTVTGGAGDDQFNIDDSLDTLTLAIEGGANDAGGDTFTLATAGIDKNWVIDGAASGNLNGRITFIEIENIQGAEGSAPAADDSFEITDTFAGNIDARGGNDRIVYNDPQVVPVSLGTALGGITGVEIVQADGDGDGDGDQYTLDLDASVETNWEISDLGGLVAGVDGINDGEITGGSDSIIFIDFGNLTGSDQNDIFTVDVSGSVTGVLTGIDGGLGNNTIVGRDTATTWNVNGATNTLADTATYVANFSNIQNLIGGDLTDTFVLANTVSGFTIDGSVNDMGETNSLQVTSNDDISGNDSVAWTVDDTNGGSVAGIVNDFSDIQDLIGGDGDDSFSIALTGVINSITGGNSVLGVDSITGPNTATELDWSITGDQTGSLSDAAMTTTFVTGFSEIENLVGSNSSVDQFLFSTSASNLAVDGGSGGFTDTADFSGVSADITVQVGGVDNGISNIELVAGNADTNEATLTLVSTSDADWSLQSISGHDGVNDGEITTLGLEFANFNNITGGDGADTFVVANDGSLTGILNGGGGANILQGRDDATASNVWTIGGVAGTLSRDDGVTTTAYVAGFEQTQTLIGAASNDDQFNFFVTTPFVNAITAGEGLGTTDTVSFAGAAGNVAITAGAGGFDEIERYVGNQDGLASPASNTSSLTVSSTLGQQVDWDIHAFDPGFDGINDGVVTNVSASESFEFVNFNELIGDAGDDTFNFRFDAGDSGLQGNGVIGLLNGGADGQDVVFGRNVDTDWNITGDGAGSFDYDDGTSTQRTTNFTEIEIVRGGSAQDEFFMTGLTFFPAITLDGGDHAVGAEDAVTLPDVNDVELTIGVAAIGGLGIENIESVIAVGVNNALRASEGNSNPIEWRFDGSNSGSIDVDGSVTQFSGFTNFIGATDQVDNFTIADGGSATQLNGSISDITLNDAITDTLTVSNSTNTTNWTISGDESGTVSDEALSTLVGSFSGIEELIGGTGADNFTVSAPANININGQLGIEVDSVQVADGTNTWLLTSSSEGVLNTNTSFQGIEVLVGGTGDDTFDFNFDGTFGTSVDGGDGFNTVDLADVTDSSFSASTTINGVANTDRVIGNGTGTVNGASLTWRIWSIDGNDALADGVNDGSISQAGTSDSVVFINYANLVGQSDVLDEFTIEDGAQFNGAIDGATGGGADFLTVQTANRQWVLDDAHRRSRNREYRQYRF